MELCQGGDMHQRMDQQGRPFHEIEIVKFLPNLVKALMHCHSQNIIHRDIKPGNIMFDSSGEIKFIDFGVAVTL